MSDDDLSSARTQTRQQESYELRVARHSMASSDHGATVSRGEGVAAPSEAGSE